MMNNPKTKVFILHDNAIRDRLKREGALIKELEKEVLRFLDEVAGKVAKLIEQYGRVA